MRDIHVLAKTGAREDSIFFDSEAGEYLVATTAQPMEGKANDAIIHLLAEYFDIPRSHVVLRKGATSRHKVFRVNI